MAPIDTLHQIMLNGSLTRETFGSARIELRTRDWFQMRLGGSTLRISTGDAMRAISDLALVPTVAHGDTVTWALPPTTAERLANMERVIDGMCFKDNLETLVEKVREWGRDVGITGPDGTGTALAQAKKLIEEAHEVQEAVEDGDHANLLLEMGDSLVVVTLLADLAGASVATCLRAAHEKIVKRTGKMVDGTFVKDA